MIFISRFIFLDFFRLFGGGFSSLSLSPLFGTLSVCFFDKPGMCWKFISPVIQIFLLFFFFLLEVGAKGGEFDLDGNLRYTRILSLWHESIYVFTGYETNLFCLLVLDDWNVLFFSPM